MRGKYKRVYEFMPLKGPIGAQLPAPTPWRAAANNIEMLQLVEEIAEQPLQLLCS